MNSARVRLIFHSILHYTEQTIRKGVETSEWKRIIEGMKNECAMRDGLSVSREIERKAVVPERKG